MTDSEATPRKEMNDLVAVIERASAELALAEEPSGFIAALESGGDDE